LYVGEDLSIYRATWLLIAVNLVAYVFTSILSGNIVYMDTSVLAFLGQYNLYVIEHGAWWQLFTAMFIHYTIGHIAFNMFFLFLLGVQFERLFGGQMLIKTYLFTGFLGNLMSLFLLPPYIVNVGASGAIFGIFGALIMFQARVGGNFRATLMYGLFIVLINSVMPNINFVAHVGGFIGGIITGYYLSSRYLRYFTPYRYRILTY